MIYVVFTLMKRTEHEAFHVDTVLLVTLRMIIILFFDTDCLVWAFSTCPLIVLLGLDQDALPLGSDSYGLCDLHDLG